MEEITPFCKADNLELQRGFKPVKPQPGLLLLDFDGYGFYEGCDATELDRQYIRALVDTDFSFCEMFTTYNELDYNLFPGPKQRVCFTNSGIGVLGHAVMFSMVTGDEQNPALVWWYGAVNNIGTIPRHLAGQVAVHEVGHTLGLWHVNQFGMKMNSAIPPCETEWSIDGINENGEKQNDKRVVGKTVRLKR